MRGVCLLLLLSLLCSRRALGLQCYSCSGIQNSGQCLPTTCQVGYNICFKVMLSATKDYGSGHEITMEHHGCAPSCEAISQSFQGGFWGTEPEITMEDLSQQASPKLELRDVTCCHQNLCNGPRLVASAPGVPGMGLLFILAPALLWALL